MRVERRSKNVAKRGSRPICSIDEVNQRFNKWSFLLWGWIEPSSIASIFRKRESRPRPTDQRRGILGGDLEGRIDRIVPEHAVSFLFFRFTAAYSHEPFENIRVVPFSFHPPSPSPSSVPLKLKHVERQGKVREWLEDKRPNFHGKNILKTGIHRKHNCRRLLDDSQCKHER